MADTRPPLILNEASPGNQPTLVLLSGGLDSAALAAHEAQTRLVQPVYVSTGMAWEAGELEALGFLLDAPPFQTRIRPLLRLDFGMRDIYSESHWAVRGAPPARDTPDDAVYLPGRNIALLAKAAVFAASRDIHRLAIGPLAGNPFPDATPEFFSAMARALSIGLAEPIEIATPFAALHKSDVIRLGAALGVPFELTLSCMNPAGRRHCGSCSKCRERQDAFTEAGVPDPSDYVSPRPIQAGED
jgi:7-cyano-7-deazaguanine synthase